MTWAVVHRIGSQRIVRLVVTGAPQGVKRRDVQDALDALGLGARFSEGGVPWGNHQLVSVERAAADVQKEARRRDVTKMDWATVERRAGSAVRNITIKAPLSLHGDLTLAAERAGVSLHSYLLDVLEGAR